jgi:CheY-like chemotaxis protein
MPTPTSSGTRRRPGRVLVIDDEPLLGRGLSRTLGDGGHEVVVVSSAASALERLLAGERYDLVLCDLMMPSMDGIDFHWRLAAVLPEEAARIVFVTGGAITERTEAFFHQVPNLLLEKPIDTDGLRALIDRRIRSEDSEDPERARGPG